MISVIICSYNRCNQLSNVLESLLSLRAGAVDYEIIIVDNNSSDKTKEVVESYMSKNNKIKYVFEPNQGISSARNAGAQYAKGDIFAFTDDDVLVDKDWLMNIAQFHTACDFDAVGGKILPLSPDSAPRWVKECQNMLSGPIVCHDCGPKIKIYDDQMSGFVGANMIIKRANFEELGGFNLDLGPGKGTMGEDTDYYLKFKKAGKKVFYNPNILVYHPVQKNRMSLQYLAKWYIDSGRYEAIKDMKNLKNAVLYFGVPRYLLAAVVKDSFSLLFSIGKTRPFIKIWRILFIKIGMIQVCYQEYGSR